MPSIAPGFEEASVFRALFAASPDALLVADGGGVIVLANPAAVALLGYAGDELLGLGVDALVPDGTRPRHAAYRERYGQEPKPRPMGLQMDLVARRKDGSEVPVEIALSPLTVNGAPLVLAAIRDVGSYPRVRQALQRARYSEHLAQLGRIVVDAREPAAALERVAPLAAEALQVEMALVWLADVDGHSCRLASGIGLLPEEPVGLRVAATPDTPPGHVIATGGPVIVEDYRLERRFAVPRPYLDAGLVSALAVPLSDRGRLIGVLAVRSRQARRFGNEEARFLESLSNLLATHLQRARSEEALNHAQRLESVGQLTGGIAHDFNNLLTVIQGNLQVLEELPLLAGEGHAQQLVAAATRASRRGAELTGKLLAFARRQVLQPSAVDVEALLVSLADMLRRTLDPQIRIEVDAASGGLHCLADAGQLESALLNVAINARDAMPAGGTLRFEARPCDRLPADAHGAHGEPPTGGDFVAISVTDTGSGMTHAVRERVFEPFFTTKDAGRGTGLGLSTVYGFVQQSRGGVAIESAPGRGTTLSLFIPRHREAAPALPVTEADEAPRPGLRVLLVEDDPEVRNVVEAGLRTLGCDFASVASAEQALTVLDAAPAFDLLLTDIALGPGLRGTALAATVRERFPAMGVVLMSGDPAELLDADRDAPPDWALLRKPYSRGELARALATVTRG